MPDAVVDIGNSRVKVCRTSGRTLRLPPRGLPADDPAAWERLAEEWEFGPGRVWAVASTDPDRRTQFIDWVGSRLEKAIAIDTVRKVPIDVRVDEPDRVGIDRLLNALAATALVKPGQAAIIVDAGSAVTVDLLNERGRFGGGTIFPGVRLMALALRDYTAQLPLVDASGTVPGGPPGLNTVAAMKLGILYAVAGGIDALVRETATRCSPAPYLVLTGGDMTPQLARLLQSRLYFESELRPALTLEGILRAADDLA